jgi:hypothetical protein
MFILNQFILSQINMQPFRFCSKSKSVVASGTDDPALKMLSSLFKGDRGETGEMGLQGIKGDKGDTGATFIGDEFT